MTDAKATPPLMTAERWKGMVEYMRDAFVAQHVFKANIGYNDLGRPFIQKGSSVVQIPRYTSTAYGLLILVNHMRKHGYTDGKFILRDQRFVWIWAGEGKPNLQAGFTHLIDSAYLAALKDGE